MMQSLRTLLHSRWGVVLALALFGIIALAFALSDVASSGNFAAITGGERVATVGTTAISPAELTSEIDQGFENARQRQPQLTIKAFLLGGGMTEVADALFDRAAIMAFGASHGIVAGKRLVDSELAKIPALQGPDGHFSEATYRQLLSQRRMTDADVHKRIAMTLVARQVLLPAAFGATMPAGIASRYVALLREQRRGTVGVLPAAAFAPKAPPSNATLATFYATNRAAFARPERRVIRYAVFDASVLRNLAPPSEAAISAYYAANGARFSASETRTLTTLILPDEASAKAVAATLSRGTSLAAAAKARGLATATLAPLTREALSAQTAPEVANAAFAAREHGLAGPIKTALGWYLVHIDRVVRTPAKSLAQARSEIVAALTQKARTAAFADTTARIDAGFGKGGALADAAKDLGLTLSQTEPLTSDGAVYGKPGAAGLPKPLSPILATAFGMEHAHTPQLTELAGGKSFVIFDVAEIEASGPAPLAEISHDVATLWALKQGSDAAHAAATQVLAAMKHGAGLAPALAALKVPLLPVQPINANREQLTKMNGQVPPTLAAFFDMAPGTTRVIALPGNRGWLVLRLDTVSPGTVAPGDPLIAQTASELGKLAGDEYAAQLRAAIRAEVGVQRNEAAIRNVVSRLVGGN